MCLASLPQQLRLKSSLSEITAKASGAEGCRFETSHLYQYLMVVLSFRKDFQTNRGFGCCKRILLFILSHCFEGFRLTETQNSY